MSSIFHYWFKRWTRHPLRLRVDVIWFWNLKRRYNFWKVTLKNVSNFILIFNDFSYFLLRWQKQQILFYHKTCFYRKEKRLYSFPEFLIVSNVFNIMVFVIIPYRFPQKRDTMIRRFTNVFLLSSVLRFKNLLRSSFLSIILMIALKFPYW